jgi:hypothetical protein
MLMNPKHRAYLQLIQLTFHYFTIDGDCECAIFLYSVMSVFQEWMGAVIYA